MLAQGDRVAWWVRRLHPSVLAASIGIFGCSLAFDYGTRAARDQFVYARGAYTLIGLGLAVGVVGLVLLVLDLARYPKGGAARRGGLRYLLVIDVMLAWFAISFAIRYPGGTIQMGLGLVGFSVLVFLAAVVSHFLYLRLSAVIDDQASAEPAGAAAPDPAG